MKAKLLVLTIFLMITSCARIPIQSIDLMSNIQKEGERMHKINITLVNLIFNEKRQKIDNFIRLEYTPKYIEEITKLIPDNIDIKNELPHILNASMQKIIEKRGAMENALEINRIKILDRLNEDHRVFQLACDELKKLLVSAVKVDEERKKLLSQASQLSQNGVDFNKLESVLDRFIQDSSDWGQNIYQLNENIDTLLNK
ncbi:MAG: hypothetical protein CVT92_15240 [Bacteroidetes bacterium HGW-Bacteroidetes-1]|jgi:hypothetical protein|nr:MAG: hypothetical protein CVT92_15240 [Bacteroidetes bacterium HGW-Bacteroidetes-1]